MKLNYGTMNLSEDNAYKIFSIEPTIGHSTNNIFQ